ncbi:hypothetical protein [Streptomyces hoynatensis]|uniref:Uncharacterized protein n=1 Tax=Streptomyces hoynatensis TaxID=1141874 RepID=A0A3A9YYF4_9ACTN|nr:hypothetical protein [Streptomyces hoynatensis]RKN40724.1 hypothetical protein D7294_16655 [Streptomyces hoynatensis]
MLYAPPESRPAPAAEAERAPEAVLGRAQAREAARAAREVLVRQVSAALQRALDRRDDAAGPED